MVARRHQGVVFRLLASCGNGCAAAPGVAISTARELRQWLRGGTRRRISTARELRQWSRGGTWASAFRLLASCGNAHTKRLKNGSIMDSRLDIRARTR